MIEFSYVGQLRSPVVVASFEGWSDAAGAASAAVEHLETVFGARLIGTVDPDDYYDFRVNRPTVSGTEPSTRSICWPTTRLSAARLPAAGSDLIVIRGLEPNMRWRGFVRELADAVHSLGTGLVVTLASLLADFPHTRPPAIAATAGDQQTAARLGVALSRYEGPTGVAGVFANAVARAGLPSVSFDAAVPHYVASRPCPKVTLALLRRVEKVLGAAVPLGDLPERSRDWDLAADELVAGDSAIIEYVEMLEKREPASAGP
jgi:hypothetical protein